MRLIVIVVALLALTAPGAAAVALQVTDPSPFTVQGTGFAPGERVTIVVQVGGRHVKVVTASNAGTFTVRFSVSLGDCPAYIVRATGNRGSQARLRSMPDCAAPTTTP